MNLHRRAVWIAGTILVTASVSGYFMGLRQTDSRPSQVRTISLVEAPQASLAAGPDVPRAGVYTEQNRLADGPNAAWKNNVATLAQPAVDVHSLTNVTAAERASALLVRASRRAYDGAPPTVPHPVAQDSAASCLTCHGEGMVIKDKVASKISHPHYTSCTQCHVPAGGPRIPIVETALLRPFTANDFAGLPAPLKGARAWPQAPPTVPHSTLMRSDCNSCHGPQGLFGLRTPHPDRQSCTQCHAPGAEMDQRLFLPAFAGPGSLTLFDVTANRP